MVCSNKNYCQQSFYDNVEVKQVDVSSTTGTFGILPNHVPAISVLKPGPILVYEGEKIKKFFGMSTPSFHGGIMSFPHLFLAFS